MRVRNGGSSFMGRGVSTDIIEASARAYLQAINLIETEKHKEKGKLQPEVI